MATERTVNRLIKSIYQLYKGSGVSVRADDALALKEMIQDRLSEWSGQITVPILTTEYLAMVSGTASYTIGENGTPSKSTTRPHVITGAYVRQSNYDYPVEIIEESEYRNITDKTSSGRPERLYPNYTTPNITIYLYPVPDTTDNLYFVSVKDFSEPTRMDADTFNTLGFTGTIYNALKWRVAWDAASLLLDPERPAPANVQYNAMESYNRMIEQHLARNMRGAVVEMAYSGGQQGGYSLSDFFAGE